jgi:hypothetical protein
MIQVLNKVIPFGGFKAMAAWPFIFLRRDKEFTEVDIRHESIHGRQQVEMLLVLFYVAYLICWLIELVRCARDKDRGQIADSHYKRRKYLHRVEHSIIFEREAYAEERSTNYVHKRRFWAWIKY